MWVDEACAGTDVDKSMLLVLLRKTGEIDCGFIMRFTGLYIRDLHYRSPTWTCPQMLRIRPSLAAEKERETCRGSVINSSGGNFPTAKKCFKNSGPTNQEILATLHRRNNYCRRERDKSHQVGWRKVRYCSGRVSHGACWVSYHKWCLLQTTTTIVDNKH